MLNIQPNLAKRQCDGWLAVCPAGSLVSFGVIGETLDDAAAKFSATATLWAILLDYDEVSCMAGELNSLCMTAT